MKTASGEGTAALDKALDVLEAVGGAPQGLSQAELSARLAVPRTTLYRLLATLVARGMVRRDPLRRVYCLGFRCFELARSAYAMPDVVAAAGMELRALRDLTGETSYFATLEGLEVLSLERCDGAHSQRSHAALGERKPLHCTSQGKAILAALPEAERDALVRDIALKALTPRTITDRRRLQAELRVTAARGWSVDDEEIVPGVRCVGAAVVDGTGQVRGAISVAGPAYRMTLERLQALGPEVAEAARRVGAQLSLVNAATGPAVARAIEGPWAFHGAFARWSGMHRCLFWADRLAPSVRLFDGLQDREVAVFDAPITALAIAGPALLVGSQAGYWRIKDAAGPQPQVQPLQPWRGAPSALCTAPDGALWACHAQPPGRYRVGPWEGSAAGEGWSLNEPASALAWDASGAQLYAVLQDSAELLVMRRGEAGVRRLASVPKGSGRPGGLAVDAQGGLWTALEDGWGVVRFSPDGTQDRLVSLPVPCPSDVAIGGAGGDMLFVTSARQSVSLEVLGNAPLSGRLFCIDAAVG